MKVSDGVFKHIIENGTGNLPGQYYTVSFHVVGTLPDGREFENTKYLIYFLVMILLQ